MLPYRASNSRSCISSLVEVSIIHDPAVSAIDTGVDDRASLVCTSCLLLIESYFVFPAFLTGLVSDSVLTDILFPNTLDF